MTTDTVISLYYPILFSFSLVLPTMINLFKKNIHSKLLSCTTTVQCQHHPISDLGLITATMNIDRPPNVLESATLKPNPPPPSTSPSVGIEFNDDRVDGLMSCTESLGFESSDEIHSKNGDEKVHDHDDDDDDIENEDDEIWRRRMMMRAEGRGNWRSFPPPLSSLNRNGKPSFFLRPVRKDGRLELTEVRIHRPEILHASRHDGRLTLHLIPDQTTIEEEEEEVDEEEELDEEEEEELVEEGEVKEEIIMEEEEEEEENGYGREERVAEWEFRVGSNEGLRRCHEMVNQHHHHVHGNHHHLRMCGISIV